jgi:hypothetical protein
MLKTLARWILRKELKEQGELFKVLRRINSLQANRLIAPEPLPRQQPRPRWKRNRGRQ